MNFRSRGFQLAVTICLGAIVMLLPRPEGTKFEITGDPGQLVLDKVRDHFVLAEPPKEGGSTYMVAARQPGTETATAAFLEATAVELNLGSAQVDYVDGLSPKAKRFLAILAALIFLFIAEPIPLEITAICIGVFMVLFGITDVKDAWAPYMDPVVMFIIACLVFAIAAEKAGLTKRLGYFIIKKAGTSVVRFTFIISIGLGLASTVMHDAAACAIGIVTMIPLMRTVGIQPHSRTAKFMMLSLPFACSCGGMGTLVGGGRCMVAAAFLKEFTGIEITFLDWIKYCMPAAMLTVPAAVFLVYLIFRPNDTYTLPQFDESLGPWTGLEKKTLLIIGITFILWLTKSYHGIHYSVTGMLGIAVLVILRVLNWEDIQSNLEWGTAVCIFGGGISLGLAMGYSGAADYFANLLFPLVQGGGWLLLFIGVGIFGALVTNAMANVAAAALILPIVIPMAQLEGVNPAVLAMCLATSASFAMLLVIGCPPNAIAYSYRYFKSSDLTKAGAIVTPVLLLILVLVASVWWKFLGLV